MRTLTRFLATFAESRGSLDTFVVTLPKVTSTEQVAAFVHAASTIEDELGLADKAVRFEVQVETPQSVLGPDGTRAGGADRARVGRAADRPALRHLRLLGVLRDRRRASSRWSTRSPTTPSS